MNKENLKKMADYIETISPERFDMLEFRTGGKKNHECDSVGCVLGHCTVLDKNPLPMNYIGDINFSEWSLDFTGLYPNSDEWDYLFAPFWKAVDNTPIGAAKRIRYVLENGAPEDWHEQMIGKAPLSYLNQTK